MEPSSGANAPAEAVAVVPAGLSFHARLDRALSSETAQVGDRFTATLDEPLRASDGSIRVAQGSKLSGRVLEVDRAWLGRLTLQLDGVFVDGRLVPIDARIVRIESARVVPADATDPSTTSAFVYPEPSTTTLPPQVGGGPPAESIPVELALGAQLELVLSRPFVGATPPANATTAPEPERTNPRIEGF